MTDELEVLLVRSKNSSEMKFPKVIWEVDETLEGAAQRVLYTKARVYGKLKDYLGKWYYQSKIKNTAHIFPVLVKAEIGTVLGIFNTWVTINEASKLCQKHRWMNEDLDALVERCTSSGLHEEEIPLIARQSSVSQPIVASPDTGNSYNVNIEHRTHEWTIGVWSPKVSLEWIFVVTNFVLELPSVVLDQLSSAHKAQYKLPAILPSFVALFICIIELIYKGRKEQVIWRWRSSLPWFYNASQNYKPFGSFKDFVGSTCALCQFIVTAINYAQADKSINISFWPIIFAFGLLCSKMLDNPERRSIV